MPAWQSSGELNLGAKEGYVIWLGHVGGLEDDEEGLLDVLVKLETSYGELDGPCDAVDRIAICRLPEPVNFSYARNVVHRDIGKGRSYDEIQKLFDKEMKRVNSFVAMNSEAQEISGKKDESSSKKAEIA
ncbi:hypothetical protein Tco_0883874 [Tanacetum coccineum]